MDILLDYPYFWLGVLFTLSGVVMLIHTVLRSRYGHHTQGEVVKFIEKSSFTNGRASTVYYPVVRFTDQDNTLREMEFGSNPAMYSKGESIRIVYYEEKVYPTGNGWKAFYIFLS